MTTATYDLTGPLLVSELPTTTPAPSTSGVLHDWLATRRVLRQQRAFDRALSTMDSRAQAELLATARRSR